MRALPAHWRSCARLGACLLTLAAWSRADDSDWHVTHGEVRVFCPMTVGGGFEARTSSLTGSLALVTARPPVLRGELSVDLTTLDTGIGLRNEHLRDKYLEVGRGDAFGKAVLTDIHMGDLDSSTFEGRTSFTGAFSLHGAKSQVKGQADIRRDGPAVRVEASFPVALTDYGIAKPQYLGVGVRTEVRVDVSLVLAASAAQPGALR
jgi:polyisoprenoid-binding protein YceI